MARTALITGASSGIGLELARMFASDKHNLVLVARSGDKLLQLSEELKKAHDVKAMVIIADLSKVDATENIYRKLKLENISIDFLVNNAGFGDFGFFVESDWNKTEQMINLNITSLTHLTRLFLPQMVKNRFGKVLNLASTAAFQPGPLMSVYYATKAYVLHFSEAINNELKRTGVSVTALCPGATESGFQAASNMEESKLVKGRKLPTSKEVAEYGYKAMMRGRPVAIPGVMNKLLTMAPRFTPRSWVVAVARKIQEERKS
jgi:short-subunit dehydrogenase